ncbi:hypothetical protein NC653_009269 [Populus alba x Populus x berolinensis]|uniref:Uncharacterized protein n=1 Tax=Populus alba x Populus x berolinensis TaxID=444605 RepID=A0AAD6WBD7_9ROSI|nr:hypothetical protein NC653_009269 [Populus alba x Populus x berolinensis]
MLYVNYCFIHFDFKSTCYHHSYQFLFVAAATMVELGLLFVHVVNIIYMGMLLFNPSYPCVFVCFVFPGYYDVVCFVSSSIYFLYESLIWNLVAGTVSKWPQLCKLIYIYI